MREIRDISKKLVIQTNKALIFRLFSESDAPVCHIMRKDSKANVANRFITEPGVLKRCILSKTRTKELAENLLAGRRFLPLPHALLVIQEYLPFNSFERVEKLFSVGLS